MDIALIVAMSENNVIGKNNQLPWHMPNDLKHFKKLTLGHPILMGRKTFESIGRPLPGRQNIVLSMDVNFNPQGCFVAKSKEEALEMANDSQVLMVIGGSTIYQQFLPMADYIYLTVIHTQVEGDAFFPQLKDNEWAVKKVERFDADETHPYSYSFIEYARL